MTDTRDPNTSRRPRLRAHRIAPLPAALGIGLAGSATAGTVPPLQAVDDHYNVVVETSSGPVIYGNVLDNDSGGVPGNVVVDVASTSFFGGTAQVYGDGRFGAQITSACFQPQTRFINYTVRDGNSVANATAYFDFVSPFVADAYQTAADQTLSGDISLNDAPSTNPQLNALSYLLAQDGTLGHAVLDPDGHFTYTPTGGSGHDRFRYRSGTSQACNNVYYDVSVDVFPAAEPDAYGTPFEQALSANVLDNDIGANGLSVVDHTAPAHGSLLINPSGSFLYTPAAGYSGTDGFGYTIADPDGLQSVGNVVIDVGNGPVQPQDDHYSLAAGTHLAGNVLDNDSDANGDSLSAIPAQPPAHGSLALNGDGSFGYDPDAGYSGADAFTYIAEDSHGSNALVDVSLTILPVAQNDHFGTPYATALHGDVRANDLGSNLVFSLVATAQHGSLALAPDGSFDYTPAAGFSGSDGFDYRLVDGSGQNAVATVVIDVGNGAPVAGADSVTVAAGQSASGNLLVNDSDPDGGTLAAALAGAPAHGSANVSASGDFSYVPAAGFSGHDAFSYTLTDGQGGNAIGNVSVLVTPVAGADSFPVNFDGSLSGDVLGNDLGSQLSVVLITPPQHGSLSLQPDGSFVYTPNDGFHGSDGFDYQVVDAAGSSASAHVNLVVGASPVGLPALDRRALILLGSLLAWVGWRQRRRDA